MTSPRRQVDTVGSIKVCKDLGQVLHGDEAVPDIDRAASAFFRELAGWTVDPVLFK